MVIHPGKTKSMVVAARHKPQLKPLMLKLALGTDIVEQDRHQLKPLMLKLALGTDIVEQDKNTSLSP